MEHRTVICRGCQQPFEAQMLGRLPERCPECLSPKLRAQRERRANETRPTAVCAGPCGQTLWTLHEVPGVEAFCKVCGPGPGVTRRSTCRECGNSFWRSHKGRGDSPRRAALCDDCERTLKWCGTCQQAKLHTQFSTVGTKRLGLAHRCKACAAEIWHSGDKLERVARKFGITRERWLEIFEAQGGGCAVCGAEPKDIPRGYLFVDHDHRCCKGTRSCGRCVRGLLCLTCNVGIGNLGDDPSRIRAAATYLELHTVG